MCKLVEINAGASKTGKIADVKKDYIVNIIEHASTCPSIDQIILFGSSLAESCTPESDIDIAVFGQKTKYQALRSKEYLQFTSKIYDFGKFQDYDILYFQSGKKHQGSIMDNIKNGLLIYQKRCEE